MNKITNFALVAALWLGLSWCWEKKPFDIFDVTNDVKSDAEKVLEKPADVSQKISTSKQQVKKQIQYTNTETQLELLDKIDNNRLTKVEIMKSIRFAWKNEVKFFINFFKLKSQEDVVTLIWAIQQEKWLKQDNVLWENTLEYIYLNYYAKIDKSQLPHDIAQRLDTYKIMLQYPKNYIEWTNYWTLYPSSVPSVFDKDYYYWDWVWENIEWTYFNQDLYSKVEHTIKEKWVVAKLFELDWNFVVAVYIDWKINLLSYTTPWNPNIKWWIRTQTWTYSSKYSDLYHISTASASVSNVWWKNYWAVMPFAVNVNWWIYSHQWYVDWDRHSHWCIRLPYLYAKWLYEIFSKYWRITRKILDN